MYVLIIIHEILFHSTFVVITPESSKEFPWISIWRLVTLHANYCADVLKARWLRPVFAESYRLRRVALSKQLVVVHVWDAPDQWHNWRVAGVRTDPPAKLNVKTGPLPSFILEFTVLLVAVDCCFLVSTWLASELIKYGSRVVHQLSNKTMQKQSAKVSNSGPTPSLVKWGTRGDRLVRFP